jgi:hypothetical protein
VAALRAGASLYPLACLLLKNIRAISRLAGLFVELIENVLEYRLF